MKRRDFLSAAATALGPTAGSGHSAPAAAAPPAPSPLTATAAEHRQRLEAIAECNRSIRSCLRRHLIGDYLPFHAVYNLGEYPSRKPWSPDEQDERNLDELSRLGVQVVQLHEEWNDAERLFGADKFSPVNRKGFDRFLRMAHARRMKVIVYISSGYFERRDPDFRPEWARGRDLVELWYRYAHCSPCSPGWRAYFLPRVRRILDEYGVDGLYNDLGYSPLTRVKPAGDDVAAFEESTAYEGALEDLLGILYAEVKKRGGIVKVHRGGRTQPLVKSRVYDYLWVGEAVADINRLRESIKDHTPYVVPCLDLSRKRIDREDELYLNAIPYMQFPVLPAGRPFTGERTMVPGMECQPEEKDFWTRHARAIWRHRQAHPEGPHSYAWWDSCPGRPDARAAYGRWRNVYRLLSTEGTWAYLEIGENDWFEGPLAANVVASAFANTRLYLALANFNESETTVRTREEFRVVADAAARPERMWRIPARSLLVLEKAGRAL
jgi:hypothetical protein